MSSCYKTSNNKYVNCPALLSDGRIFTDYRPNCHVNNLVRANNNLTNSFQARMFLTNNATKLMDLNRTYAVQKAGCTSCKQPWQQGTMLGEQSVTSCSKQSCSTNMVNKGGLGQGRKYSKDEPSCGWPEGGLPVNQPQNCCAPSGALFNYYNHSDTKAAGELIPRLTSPGGGNALRGGDPVAFNL